MKQARRHFPYWHEATLAVLLAGLLAWAGWIDPSFLAVEAQIEMSRHIWELALVALPMTFIIITGGIDLSVGSALALSAVVLGLSYRAGLSPGAGSALALATGLAGGALNGWFVARLRVHPLIVTLATLAAFRGVAEGISLAKPVSGFPESFQFFAQGAFCGLPIPGLIFAALGLAAAAVLARSLFGRWLYAIGHNETAARFSGVPVDRVKLVIYALSGLMAALAAVMLVARHNTAKADLGSGLELEVITAVVLGGASIFGGRGNLAGTVLGVLLIHETREFVSWHWQRDELNAVIIGGLLILSILAQRALAPRTRRED